MAKKQLQYLIASHLVSLDSGGIQDAARDTQIGPHLANHMTEHHNSNITKVKGGSRYAAHQLNRDDLLCPCRGDVTGYDNKKILIIH
mgnify:CR=1 FL=1